MPGRGDGIAIVAENSLLLVVQAVLEVLLASDLVNGESDDFPACGAGYCDEDTEKGDEKASVARGYCDSGTADHTVRPIDPWSDVYMRNARV